MFPMPKFVGNRGAIAVSVVFIINRGMEGATGGRGIFNAHHLMAPIVSHLYRKQSAVVSGASPAFRHRVNSSVCIICVNLVRIGPVQEAIHGVVGSFKLMVLVIFVSLDGP